MFVGGKPESRFLDPADSATYNGLAMNAKTVLSLISALVSLCRASGAAEPERVSLAYRFMPGQVLRYRIYERTTGTRVSGDTELTSPVDLEATTVVQMRCDKVRGDRIAEIVLRTESAMLSLAGKRVASPPQVPEVSLAVGPNGKRTGASSVVPSSNLTPGTTSIESILLPMILPDESVAAGGFWGAIIPMPVHPESKLALSFRLREVKQTSQGKVSVIALEINPVVEAGAEAAPAQASQQGTGTVNFEPSRGSLQYAEGSFKSAFTTRASRSGDVTKYDLRTKFAVRRLD